MATGPDSLRPARSGSLPLGRRRAWGALAVCAQRCATALGMGEAAVGHDGWLDPLGFARVLRRQLDGETPLLARVARWRGAAPAPYLAEPAELGWLALRRGRCELKGCWPGRAGEPWLLQAAAVDLRVRTQRCCRAVRCRADRAVAEVILAVTGEPGHELLLAEAVGREPADALGQLAPLAAGLAAHLGIELRAPEQAALAELPPPSQGESGAGGYPVGELARWSMGLEGDRVVLREHALHRPAGGVAAWLVGPVALVGAAGAAVAAVRGATLDQRLLMIAVAAVAALVAVGAAAVGWQVARFAGTSRALAVLGLDRLLVGPWLSATGAVDGVLSGRYGAAVALGETGALGLRAGRGGWALDWASAHGPFEIGVLGSRSMAEAWRRRLVQLVAVLAHGAPLGVASARASTAATRGVALLAMVLVGGACGPLPAPVGHTTSGGGASTTGAADSTAVNTTTSSSRVPGATSSVTAPSPARRSVTIIEDDLPGARRLARAADKLLLVEVWARWCHTCLSMKSFVLTDPALLPLGKRVVFAAIDSDRPDSEPFVETHAVEVWPTIYLLEPEGDRVLGMWQGAMSVAELRDFIRAGLDARDASLDPAGPLASLVAAKQAHAKGHFFTAGRHYQAALRRGGPSWSRRSDALYGWIASERRQRHPGRCAQIGVEHLASVQGTALPTDLSWVLLECAEAVRDRRLARRVREAVRQRLERHTRAPPAGSSVDDRADALDLYAQMLDMAGQRSAARRARERRLGLLEAAAAAAPNPEVAATFDYPRMKAYLSLGRGAEAVAMLRKRTAQLPEAYEPWARLAEVLLAMGRAAEARTAIAHAVHLSYGPRRLRYLELQATIAHVLADRAGERRALERLLAEWRKLGATIRRSAAQRARASRAWARLRALGKWRP